MNLSSPLPDKELDFIDSTSFMHRIFFKPIRNIRETRTSLQISNFAMGIFYLLKGIVTNIEKVVNDGGKRMLLCYKQSDLLASFRKTQQSQ